jgi:hypothetical protein
MVGESGQKVEAFRPPGHVVPKPQQAGGAMVPLPKLGERPERPGQDPRMRDWADEAQDHYEAYRAKKIEPLLYKMAHDIAGSKYRTPAATDAMVAVGRYANHTYPQGLAEGIAHLDSPDQVGGLVNDSEMNSLVTRLKWDAVSSVSPADIEELRRVLSDQEIEANVVRPAFRQVFGQ